MDQRVISCPNGTVYKIKSGDSFFKLAQQFNVSVDAIIAANPGVNPNSLQIGQEICIPVKPAPGPCPGGTMYMVVAGDSFFTIARRFNVSVDALVAANPGVNPDRLQIGQQICIPGKPAPNPCPGGTLYTVVAGDSFFTIAARFNVSVDALVAANPGVNPDRLQIGQQICIPGKPAPNPCPGGTLYTVVAGDSFFTIAARFNVSVDALVAANPGVNPNNLQIGQQICIPGKPAPGPCPGGTMYTIVAGDTLYKLAIQFNTTVSAILAANPGLDPNKLQIGQKICIPGKPTPGPCPGGTLHTIVAGDTLYKLAIQFNTTVSAILAANPGLDPNKLQIGQKICIPGKPTPGPCPGETYTIRQGDTLYIIAQRLGIKLEDLLNANPGIDPNRLTVGQVICLPVKPSGPCPGGTIYVVKSGDTLLSIAKRFNVSLQQILMANPDIKDPNVIFIGQSICIPGGARSQEDPAEYLTCPFAPYFMNMF